MFVSLIWPLRKLRGFNLLFLRSSDVIRSQIYFRVLIVQFLSINLSVFTDQRNLLWKLIYHFDFKSTWKSLRLLANKNAISLLLSWSFLNYFDSFRISRGRTRGIWVVFFFKTCIMPSIIRNFTLGQVLCLILSNVHLYLYLLLLAILERILCLVNFRWGVKCTLSFLFSTFDLYLSIWFVVWWYNIIVDRCFRSLALTLTIHRL